MMMPPQPWPTSSPNVQLDHIGLHVFQVLNVSLAAEEFLSLFIQILFHDLHPGLTGKGRVPNLPTWLTPVCFVSSQLALAVPIAQA